MSYMTKAFLNEKHQGPLVNHNTFRFVSNDEESRQERGMQKYLSEVESNLDTSQISQLRRKISARFEEKIAYGLLIKCKFNYLQSEDTLQVYLASCVNLTESHKQLLANEIKSVYGEVEIKYEKPNSFNSNNSSFNFKNPRRLDNPKSQAIAAAAYKDINSEGNQKNADRLDGEIYLEELDHRSAWYKIRKEIRNNLGRGVDRSWFSKLTSCEKKEEGKILLKAPTAFIRDWINNNYGSVISQYCKLVTGFMELEGIVVDH
jgi:hypothetical protein